MQQVLRVKITQDTCPCHKTHNVHILHPNFCCLLLFQQCWVQRRPEFFWFFFLPHDWQLNPHQATLSSNQGYLWMCVLLFSPQPSPVLPPLLHRQGKMKVSASPALEMGLCVGGGAEAPNWVFLNKLGENYILCWAYDCHNSLSHNKAVSQKGKQNCWFL